MAEVKDASANVESPAFRAAAADSDNGSFFTHGLYHRQSFLSGSDEVVHGALKFLRTTSTDAGAVSDGAIAAAFDEILGDVSFSFDCSGFTATLVVEPCFDHRGKIMEVPVATTLHYLGKLDRMEETSKGASKCYVFASLLSIDGATVYARASAVFVRPVGVPRVAQLNAMYANREQYNTKRIADVEAQDAGLLNKLVLERSAVLRTMCGNTGCFQFMTHLPNFEQARELWAKNFEPGYFADSPEFRGKVFLLFLNHSLGTPLRAVANFSSCAQGPPSTAHGGSRFALLQHAAIQACLVDEERASVRLERCEVHMKARLPLNKTVRVEICVTRKGAISGGSKRLYLEGQLTDLDGKVIYDTLKAEATCTPMIATFTSEVSAMATFSKL